VAKGAGKGTTQQSEVSAYFEALEHFWLQRVPACLKSSQTLLVQASELGSVEALSRDRVTQRFSAYGDSPVGCGKFAPVSSPGTWIPYPLCLTAPEYPDQRLPDDLLSYRTLLRYMSSIGTAAGSSAEEALLHGLLERVEHDAVSLALIRWFLKSDLVLDVLDRRSTPAAEQSLWEAVERDLSSPVEVLDVTTDIGIPVYVALPHESPFAVGTSGAGCSPVSAYALHRALTELLQDHRLRMSAGDEAVAESREMLTQLVRWPRLRDCARLDGGHLFESAEVANVRLRSTVHSGSVEDTARWVVKRLGDTGLLAYSLGIASDDSGTYVTTTIVPGLETFTLVRGGLPVLPTGRGGEL
jgi:ribosomal protein S12 methylthiotransferase accessory factor